MQLELGNTFVNISLKYRESNAKDMQDVQQIIMQMCAANILVIHILQTCHSVSF